MSNQKKEVKHFIFVEQLPEDAQKIEYIRKFQPENLYFSPSECMFFRLMKNKKGEDKIKKIVPTKKGVVHCPNVDNKHKSVCISLNKFRKEWISTHPNEFVGPIPQDVSMYSTRDNNPLDPSEEEQLFQHMRGIINDLFDKHVHLNGRYDILERLLRRIKTTSQTSENNKATETPEKPQTNGIPQELKERAEEDEDEIVLSDIE